MSLQPAPPGGHDTPDPSPGVDLDALVERAFVSRGEALVAERIASVVGAREDDEGWPTALVALAVRAVRDGSTALSLADVARTTPEVARGDEDEVSETVVRLGDVVAVPSAEGLAEAVTASVLSRSGVVRVEFGLLYLDRYARDEVLIAELAEHRRLAVPALDDAARARAQEAVADIALDDAQRRAVDSVLARGLSVLTGGPGMGKTYTLAAVIRAAHAASPGLRLTLAAPTGKAAARMTESLREAAVGPNLAPDAVTLHRLLGFDRTNHQRFLHHRSNPLPHDRVVVDEASMLSLGLMARLLEALKPGARLLLVGDPDQLASVEAGSVLSDLVLGLPADEVVRLTQHHRLSASRRDLARAFARGDLEEQVDGVLSVLRSGEVGGGEHAAPIAEEPAPDPGRGDGAGAGDVTFVTGADVTLEALPHVVESAWQLRRAAASGDADAALRALRHHRLLCAHRTGPYGVARWNRLVETALADGGADVTPGRMYVGRPVIVTKNDRSLGLFNGDTGVVIEKDGQLVVLMDRGQHVVTAPTGTPDILDAPDLMRDGTDGPNTALGGAPAKRTEFSPWRLADVETMHAMTVHKAQGSQAEHVTVIVPPLGSRLLTREMLYTALTRASRKLTVVASAEAVEEAVRTPARRASSLARRLGAADATSRDSS